MMFKVKPTFEIWNKNILVDISSIERARTRLTLCALINKRMWKCLLQVSRIHFTAFIYLCIFFLSWCVKFETNKCCDDFHLIVLYFQELENTQDQPPPPLFQCHGTKDDLVLFDWGRDTFKTLTEHGVQGEFHDFDLYHEFNKTELSLLREWILNKLPSV
jgi:hypothetical protein